MSFLSVRGLTKRYGRVTALSGVALDIARGGRTAVVGASGSGKTTLLRLLAGFERPDGGEVVLDGDILAGPGVSMPVHRREIGFVPQDGALFPHLSVADNIGFGLDRGGAARDARIVELIDNVELDATVRDRFPHQLSGGQQQRVALARALARKPRLMLLDEPFSALDANLRESVRRSTAEILADAGITTILVTHDRIEALSFADHLVVLSRGTVAQAGPPRELYLRPRDRETAAFLGEAIILSATLADGWAQCALGRLRVAGDLPDGKAEIMLRPEQLALAAPGTVAAGPSVMAEVINVEFGGETSVVTATVRPSIGEGPAMRFAVRVASATSPKPGDRLAISIAGTAHPLDSPS